MANTAYSSADIVSHLTEGYFTHMDAWAPFQDGYSENLVRVIIACTEKLLVNPRDPEARATMMWAATNSWNGFYIAGVGDSGCPCHALSHSISAYYDTPHGACLLYTSRCV